MSRITDFTANQILNHIAGTAQWPFQAAVYLGLFTADPTDAGDQVSEVAGGSYSRISLAFNAASARKSLNIVVEDFPEALEIWGTVTHWGILDAAVNGNMLAYGLMQDADGNAAPRTVQVGDIVRFAQNAISLEVE